MDNNEAIRLYKQQAGISNSELSRRLGVDRATTHRWLHDHIDAPLMAVLLVHALTDTPTA